jgi:hypothetical protein
MSSAIPGEMARSAPLRAAGRGRGAQCGDGLEEAVDLGLEEAVDLVRERLIELGHGRCHQ